MSVKTVIVVDVICLMVFVLMGIYVFALPAAMQDQLMSVFMVINPFRTGAWIMGIGFLVTCLWGKAKIGLIWGSHHDGLLSDYGFCVSGWTDDGNNSI